MKNGATHLHGEADGGGKKHDLVLFTATLFPLFGLVGARSKKEKFAVAPVSLDVAIASVTLLLLLFSWFLVLSTWAAKVAAGDGKCELRRTRFFRLCGCATWKNGDYWYRQSFMTQPDTHASPHLWV